MGNKDTFVWSNPKDSQAVLAGEYDIVLSREPSTVLDIGANEGAFTAWARGKWPSCRVKAYEPIPENSEYFRRNHGSDPNVQLIPLAVSPDETFEMRYGRHNSGECSRYNTGEQNGKVVRVNAVKPESVGTADFVKIDTEGCELEILRNLDLSGTNALAIEYHFDKDVAEIKSICRKAGLSIYNQLVYNVNRGVLKFRRLDPNAKTKSVFLAMPVYRQMDSFTVQSVLGLVAEQMAKAEFGVAIKMHIGECPIGRARNDLTYDFLQSTCTHLLFVDSDIVFSYEQIKKALMHDKDIIGGFYCKKAEGKVSLVCNTLNKVDAPDKNGLLKVKYMGTGFILISRRVFEKMIELKPDLAYTDDRDGVTTKYDFWRMGVAVDIATGMKRWLSEDWQFCQFALECGFDVWADATILLRHSGMAVYPLSYQLLDLYIPEQLERMNISVPGRNPVGTDKPVTETTSPPSR